MELQLTPKDCEMLEETLQHALWSLRDQIRFSDAHESKDGLKADEALLTGLLSKIRAAVRASVPAPANSRG